MLKFVQKAAEESNFERPEGMHPVLHELLKRRGIDSVEAAKAFLEPSEAGLNDPMLLSDMDKAVDMIRASIDNGDKICVFGDYDADGVCASAIMSILLEKLEADYEVYIPSRHEEGYGLNPQAIEEIASRGTSLLITVDCGISCRKEIELAKELGMRCIVTDHHRPGEILPDCPVVNPLLNDYPFPWLCGAGVAFKLTHALMGSEAALDVVDIAAIATVADIVSMTGENRCIVYLGLQMINSSPRPGIRELIRNAGIEGKQILSGDIAFRLAPRLNAAGRLGSARRAYELLIAEDGIDAISSADILEQENTNRKKYQETISNEAMLQLKEMNLSEHKIVMVRGSNWNHGIIGLAAAHLQKSLNFPIIVFAEKDGLLTGSCRSIPGVDIFKALTSAADLMVKFGGHAQAAGLTIREEDFDEVWRRLDSYIAENSDPDSWAPVEEYDLELPMDQLDRELVDALEALEPTGCGNPAPIFRAMPEALEKRAVGSQKNHLQLIVRENGVRIKGICFGEGRRAEMLGERVDLLYEPVLNEWQGRINVEMQVKAIRNADPLWGISMIGQDIEILKRNFLTEMVYNKKCIFRHYLPVITEDDLAARIKEDIRGICLICGAKDIAEKWLNKIGPDHLAFTAGEFPNDIPCYNAVTIYPGKPTELPQSVKTVVYIGVPAPAELPEHIRAYELEGHREWDIDVPDVDEMREVYKAARRIASKPVQIKDLYDLDEKLSEESGISATACRLSMLALTDMKLIDARPIPVVLPPVKTDPQSSEVWQSICSLREA